MEKKEIKIKSVQADEIAVSTKMTIYCVVFFTVVV